VRPDSAAGTFREPIHISSVKSQTLEPFQDSSVRKPHTPGRLQ